MKRILTFILILLAIFQIACKDDPCLKSTGSKKLETRLLQDSIAVLEVRDDIDLEVYFSDRNYLEVEGGENLIPHVKHTIDGHNLLLENFNSCQFLRGFDEDLKVRLFIKDLQEFDFNSTGRTVFMDSIRTRHFEFRSEIASGDVVMRFKNYQSNFAIDGGNISVSCLGITRLLSVYTAGSSQVVAQNLEVTYCGVINESSADCLVHVTDSLEVQICSFADIIYFGDPNVEVLKRTGTGNVRTF